MKKWIFKNIEISSLVILSIFLVIFFYSIFYLPDGNLRRFVSDLSLSFITGFILSLGVSVAGTRLEESRKIESRRAELVEKLDVLKNLLKNLFQRAISGWNFSNRTPTFYFDKCLINSLYSLLIQNNREWDVFLQEYRAVVGDNELINKLDSFLVNMDKALINAENLDNKFIFSRLSPSLAASMGNGFPSFRTEAKNNSEFEYWVTRATWAGANTTEILFGIAPFTDKQLVMQRIEGLANEAINLGGSVDFMNLVKTITRDKKKLNKTVESIHKLVI